MLRRMRHGPIPREDRQPGVAFAVRFAGLEIGNFAEPSIGFFHATRLKDLQPVFDAGHFYKHHQIVADRHGDIAYFYLASTHHRNEPLRWNAPVDGSSSASQWHAAMT